ncbi:uncharacterized protein ARMOST_06500 [Armillaria ostoyae]|uniref:Uncharacterized protein n=1 Tax=Armillaria ostoyae TaxID=47428 RepID=A0A284R348_ARMOS|nr:uncharacterized protein ARMOST_06500 [Armillaria ostoyae]
MAKRYRLFTKTQKRARFSSKSMATSMHRRRFRGTNCRKERTHARGGFVPFIKFPRPTRREQRMAARRAAQELEDELDSDEAEMEFLPVVKRVRARSVSVMGMLMGVLDEPTPVSSSAPSREGTPSQEVPGPSSFPGSYTAGDIQDFSKS